MEAEVVASAALTTGSGTSITSSGFTAVAGARYYVGVLCIRTTETAGSTTSLDAVDGVTPTPVRAQAGFGTELHLSTWTFVASTSGAGRTVTANFNGTSKGAIQVVRIDDVDADTPNGTPNSSNGGGFTLTSISAALGAFAGADSAGLAFVATMGFTAQPATPRTDWTELLETACGGFEGANSGGNLSCQFRDATTDNTVSATFSSVDLACIAGFELFPGVASATAELSHYRFRENDGDEDGATWAAAEDKPHHVAPGDTFRLRTQLDYTGDPGSHARTLQYKLAEDSDDLWETVS